MQLREHAAYHSSEDTALAIHFFHFECRTQSCNKELYCAVQYSLHVGRKHQTKNSPIKTSE